MKIIHLVLFCIVSLVHAQDPVYPQSYKKSIDRWHEGRVKALTKEHGWLSLIALEWIQEGKNKIPSIGTISLSKGTLVFSFDDGMKGTLNGLPFVSGTLSPDVDKVLFGSKALSVIKRKDKYAVRVWDAQHPARKNFTAIDRYPVSESWKIEARWVKYKEPKKVVIPTVISGLLQDAVAPGVAIFTLDGKEYKLEPTIEQGEENYFFVFGDKTNGKETYGAGRFLYADPPKDGKIILDFNRSYNPPCAFTDFATCPVPTPENRLPVRIEAGEKKYMLH